MVGRVWAAALMCVLQGGAASAEVPKVVADIAPVHGLAAQVMRGLGEPALILRPGASPHDHALRPSDAAALQEAGLVVWTGAALTPWLEAPLDALAGKARILNLIGAEDTHLLEYRDEVGTHQAHDPSRHDPDGHDDAAHRHDGVDPHVWLDPDNARAWLDLLARTLSDLDPPNAAVYRRNADEGKAAVDAAEAEARLLLAPFHGTRYMVFHDAWQYFEAAFGLQPAAAIASGDAATPGPARLSALRGLVAEDAITCVFSEPQFSDAMIATVFEGANVTHAVLDPMGARIPPGPDFYPALLRGIAAAMAGCAD